MDKNEGNKLIAKFMGISYKEEEMYADNGLLRYCHKYIWGFNDEWYDGELGFHESWDWLMPCIKKIREILNTELSFNDYDNWRYLQVTLNPFNYDIDFIHSKVVVFIQWYNNQKQ